jgi:hypothetical protein
MAAEPRVKELAVRIAIDAGEGLTSTTEIRGPLADVVPLVRQVLDALHPPRKGAAWGGRT